MKDSLKYKDSNTAISYHLQAWSYTGYAVKETQAAFAEIPKEYFPNSPAEELFFPIGTMGIAKIFTTYILPLLPVLSLVSSWINLVDTFGRYFNAKNKNYDNTLDLLVNFITTSATTVFWGLLILGSTNSAVFTAPYILAGALGVSSLYGLYTLIKSAKDAYSAKTTKDKRHFYWKTWRHLLSFALNTLSFASAITFGVQVGPKLAEASILFRQALGNWDLYKLAHALSLTRAADSLFRASQTLFYAFTGVLTLGMATSACEMNWQTVRYLNNPGLILENISARYKSIKAAINAVPFLLRPIAVIVAIPLTTAYVVLDTVNLFARVLSLVVWPFQPENPNEEVKLTPRQKAMKQFGSLKKPMGTTQAQVMKQIQERKVGYDKLCQQVDKTIKLIENDMTKLEKTEKRLQKYDFLMKLKKQKLLIYNFEQPVDDFVKASGPLIFQSFWCRRGRVEKIAHAIDVYDQKFLQATK